MPLDVSFNPGAGYTVNPIVSQANGVDMPDLVAWNTAIPLDTAAGGKYMAEKLVNSNLVLTVGSGPVQDGNCTICLTGNGTNTVDMSAFVAGNSYVFDNTAGRKNIFTIIYQYGTAYRFGVAGALTDVIAPTIVSAVVENANPDRIVCTTSESVNSTLGPASQFAVSAGHPITAITYVDATHFYLTTSTPFVNGETARTLAGTKPGADPRVKDLANIPLESFSGLAITNNVAVADLIETFDRANSTSGLGTPSDSGPAWEYYNTNYFGINGNAAYNHTPGTSGGAGGTMAVRNANDADVTVRARFNFDAMAYEYPGLVLRASGANDLLVLHVETLTSTRPTVKLLKREAGTWSEVVAATTAPTQTHDDAKWLEATLSGSTITAKYGGETIFTQGSVTFNQTATRHGLRLDGGGGISGLARVFQHEILAT